MCVQILEAFDKQELTSMQKKKVVHLKTWDGKFGNLFEVMLNFK